MKKALRPATFLLPLVLAGLVEGAGAAEVQIGAHTFTLADGFEIELVAGPPLVERPMMVDFDDQGRLYVADSSGSNDKKDDLLAKKPHRIVRLVDKDGDGRFDERTVFADGLTFPQGVLWYQGAVYSASAPDIWKLEDTNGDGVADRRTAWLSGFALTACANDLHGPTLGIDGRFYWTKGGFQPIRVEPPGGPVFAGRASHVFRARPDGRDLEAVIGAGMDNPVEVTMTTEGEPIFTCTFYTSPQDGKRDALIHAVWGGAYPKVHPVVEDVKRTGDFMPALAHLGPAAPSGLARYESAMFGEGYRENLFSALFNLRKIQRHTLARQGATFKSRDEDFLVSDNPDFHPTDVIEDADGSLLVVDTGGWFRICCPTSQIAKPEVLGGIYRVRRKGARPPEDPRGLKIGWPTIATEELAALLGDARVFVRRRAIETIARREDAVPVLARTLTAKASPEVRRRALWALARIDGPPARAAVRAALRDRDELTRIAAINVTSLHRDGAAVSTLLPVLRARSPHLARAAATALGRIGNRDAVAALLAATAGRHDRVLEHALIYALIEIGDRSALEQALKARNPRTRRAAMLALDQTDGRVDPSAVIPHLSSRDPLLKETAWWIVGRHKDWGAALRPYVHNVLGAPKLAEKNAAEMRERLKPLASEPAVQEMLADLLLEARASNTARLLALQLLGDGSVKTRPSNWAEALRRTLESDDGRIVGATLALLRARRPEVAGDLKSVAPVLERLVADSGRPAELRLDALEALPLESKPLDPALFEFVLGSLDPAGPSAPLARAAGVLGRARLTAPQLLAVAPRVSSLGVLDLPKLLPAFAGSGDPKVGRALLLALGESRATGNLRAQALREIVKRYPEDVRREAERLAHRLEPDGEAQAARLAELTSALAMGDRLQGSRLFSSPKAGCALCHQIGAMGGRLGPDLTKIGAARSDRDLLEAIVFPSASFARGYEPVVVRTKDGGEHPGVIREETADSVALASNPTTELRLARSDIVEILPGAVSVMPGGLDEALTSQEIADLVAFLRSLRDLPR
jgi:putative membrane-bound dehydrogenase-like protein